VVACAGLVAWSSLASANLAGSNFESNDGNMVVNTPGNEDWSNAPNLHVGQDLPSGTGDNSFGQGTHENDLTPTVVAGSIPNSKADLAQFAVASEQIANGDTILYLAWTRASQSGTTNFDFELNAKAQPNLTTPGPKTLVRTVGDALISYDFQGGAQRPTLTLHRWLASNVWDAGTVLGSNVADGQVNSTPIPNLFGTPTPLPNAQFGEAAVDLNLAGIINPNVCENIASAFVKSRASNSFSAEIKDFIAPIATGINTCSTLIVKKVTDPSPDPTNTAFSFTSNAGSVQPIKDGQSYTISSSLNPGTYNIAENLPQGWTLTGHTCDNGDDPSSIHITGPKQTVTCTFTNTARGHIIIKKVTDPSGASQSFTFTPSYNGGATFNLTDGQSNDSGELVPGTYSVAETPVPGWNLTNASCSDGSPVNAISLQPGEIVTCTFSNRTRGHIIIVKHTDPAGSAKVFTFDPSYGPSFNLTDGQSNDSGELVPGTYNVAEESAGPEWTPLGSSCDNGDAVTAIHLGPGQTITCTFTNQQLGHVIVKKVTDPIGSTQAFMFNSNYGPSFNLTDGQSNDSGPLVTGIYSVSEVPQDGWTPIGATCDNGNPPSAVHVNPGQTVTCTFVNQQKSHIVVVKQTIPAGAQASFHFTDNYGAPFDLSDGQSSDSGAIIPGTYNVAEDGQTGWENISATCDNGEAPSAIHLGPGQVVTCTFVNRQQGHIIVHKAIQGPADTTTQFGFSSNYGADFSINSTQSNDSGLLTTGTYNVSEHALAHWQLVSATCDDGDAPAAIHLAPGQTINCTFTNELLVGSITIHKTHLLKTAGGDQPEANVMFVVTGPSGTFNVTTDVNGNACVDSLFFGPYTVHELVPAGESVDVNDQTVTVSTVSYCGDGNGQSVMFHNTPLTDIHVTTHSEVVGGTASTITCEPNASSGPAVSEASLDDDGLLPGTYHCTVVIDP
jgi:hypothetical protein